MEKEGGGGPPKGSFVFFGKKTGEEKTYFKFSFCVSWNSRTISKEEFETCSS